MSINPPPPAILRALRKIAPTKTKHPARSTLAHWSGGAWGVTDADASVLAIWIPTGGSGPAKGESPAFLLPRAGELPSGPLALSEDRTRLESPGGSVPVLPPDGFPCVAPGPLFPAWSVGPRVLADLAPFCDQDRDSAVLGGVHLGRAESSYRSPSGDGPLAIATDGKVAACLPIEAAPVTWEGSRDMTLHSSLVHALVALPPAIGDWTVCSVGVRTDTRGVPDLSPHHRPGGPLCVTVPYADGSLLVYGRSVEGNYPAGQLAQIMFPEDTFPPLPEDPEGRIPSRTYGVPCRLPTTAPKTKRVVVCEGDAWQLQDQRGRWSGTFPRQVAFVGFRLNDVCAFALANDLCAGTQPLTYEGKGAARAYVFNNPNRRAGVLLMSCTMPEKLSFAGSEAWPQDSQTPKAPKAPKAKATKAKATKAKATKAKTPEAPKTPKTPKTPKAPDSALLSRIAAFLRQCGPVGIELAEEMDNLL